jgi:hypothetical protein
MDKIREEFLEKMNVDAVVEFNDLWTSVEKTGLVMEVIFTALEEMKSNPQSSPLLCLQIAANDWDV